MEIEGTGINPISTDKIDTNDRSKNLTKASPGTNFGDILSDAISKVNDLENESDKMSEKLAMGEVDNLHDVVIASEKADLALNLTIQVRNKLVESYE